MLEKGLTHTSRIIVANCDTAVALGSGDLPVLATPRMAILLENAAMVAVATELPDGSTTVGGHIDVSHLKPTPIGAVIEAWLNSFYVQLNINLLSITVKNNP